MVRGLLVVNPRATTTSPRVTDVLIHAFADELDLEVCLTTHRGHAIALGEQARDTGLDVVVTLGGDGVVNEVINGLLRAGPGPEVPMLGTVPGGSGNVFARAIGLPADAVEATGQLLDAIREQRTRTIGLGRANDRWFATNAGLGVDAAVIAAMERQRATGRRATPVRYLATTVRTLVRDTDHSEPALLLNRPGSPDERVFFAIVQNTSPWTYLGMWAVDPCPTASFDTGLDVFALRRFGVAATLQAAGRMISHSTRSSSSTVVWHDQTEFTVTARYPVPLQIDGEGVGMSSHVHFEAVPAALRVLH